MRVRPAVIVVLLLAAGCTRTKASEVTVASQSASTADVTTAGRAAPVGGGSTPAGTTQPNASTPQTTKPASAAPPTATSQPITQPTSTQPITSQPATSQPITQPASTQPATDRAQAVPVSPPPAPIVWRKCTGNRTECATLVVPLDYRHPTDGQTISLKLKRRLATGTSIGPLLVNPGGPGVGGTVMVDGAEGYFDAALLEKFDITAWDPRGTGDSDGIVCLDDVDQFLALDPTPDDAAERQAIVDADALFANGCKTRSGRVLPFVSTEDSARDIDQIRQALGVAQISYFGFSYGSRLGATYATLFPSGVRTMVIDGAEDPDATGTQASLQQVIGFENAFESYLASCASDTACPFRHGGDPGTAFDALMNKLDAKPLSVRSNRAKVNQGVAINAVAEVLYADGRWPLLSRALAAAERGDGSALLSLYDSYTRRNSPGEEHLFDAFEVISCLDKPGPTNAADAQALIDQATIAAPRLGRYLSSPSIVCAQLPSSPSSPSSAKVTGAGAGNILVVGTTGDPATPYSDTVKMAKALEGGVLLTVKANQHTGYGANTCASATVDNVLINKVFPPAGTVCG